MDLFNSSLLCQHQLFAMDKFIHVFPSSVFLKFVCAHRFCRIQCVQPTIKPDPTIILQTEAGPCMRTTTQKELHYDE